MLLSLELFVMLVIANGSPVVVARLCRGCASWPVDGGRLAPDGRRVFGASKTWRGLISGTLACLAFAVWTGFDWLFGALFGLLSLFGDLASSFIKRRMGLASSARALGLDQLPEALLPMLLAWYWLGLPLGQAIAIGILFALANVVFSPLLYRLGIRNRPH